MQEEEGNVPGGDAEGEKPAPEPTAEGKAEQADKREKDAEVDVKAAVRFAGLGVHSCRERVICCAKRCTMAITTHARDRPLFGTAMRDMGQTQLGVVGVGAM
jgi:hypothetical protein